MARRVLVPVVVATLVAGLVCTGGMAMAQASKAGPEATVGDALVQEGIAAIAAQAMGAGAINWERVERELAATFGSDGSHAALAAAVAMLNDPHASFSPPANVAATGAAPAPSDGTSNASAAGDVPVLTIPLTPEGRLLEDGVAYLVVPGCTAPDVDGLRAYAKAAALELARLGLQKPRGWLVDLRLNGGGNLWPMLLGLRPLLPDGPLMSMVKDGQVQSRFGLGAGGAWIDWGSGAEMQLDWGADGAPVAMEPLAGRIALLTGPWTMSSGEALAICLLNRASSRSFGEPTAGLTTVTNQYRLSDGSTLTLPVARMGDRDGHAVAGAIEPMQVEPLGDWPAPDDVAAGAARAWLIEAFVPERSQR